MAGSGNTGHPARNLDRQHVDIMVAR